MQLTPAQIKSLHSHLFVEDKPEFAAGDDYACTYRGWTVGLSIPNGGILAVSITQSEQAFSCLTEGLEDLPTYYETDAHIALAKKAIDSILGEAPIQFDLLTPTIDTLPMARHRTTGEEGAILPRNAGVSVGGRFHNWSDEWEPIDRVHEIKTTPSIEAGRYRGEGC